MVKDLLGNQETISVLVDWLNIYYHQPTKEIPNYAILFGSTGNGKTYIPTVLAKEFGVERFRITVDDIKSNEDFNQIIKSINMATLDGAKHKLILVDDVDAFQSKYQTRLFEIGKISKNPVIYTSSTFSLPFNASDFMKEKWAEFIKDSLKKVARSPEGRIIWSKLLKIEKPTVDDLFGYLKSISKLPDDTLRMIAEKSKSVRSAVLSTYNIAINDLTDGIATKGDLLKSITKRQLDEPLTRENIDFIFKAIRGYDDNAFKVMKKFADFNYRIKAKYEEIDPIFVNEMEEPIEKIKLSYPKFERSNNTQKKAYDQKKPESKKKEQTPKQEPSLGKWI